MSQLPNKRQSVQIQSTPQPPRPPRKDSKAPSLARNNSTVSTLSMSRSLVGSPSLVGAEFNVNFSQFQQQLQDEQRSIRSQMLASQPKKVGNRKGSSADAANDEPMHIVLGRAVSHQPQPPATKSNKINPNRLDNLPPVVAPVATSHGELQFVAPGQSKMALEHLFSKACRQFEARIAKQTMREAAILIQRWYRKYFAVRRCVKDKLVLSRVKVLLHTRCIAWARRARRTVQLRHTSSTWTSVSEEAVGAAVRIQCCWRRHNALALVARLKLVAQESLAHLVLRQKMATAIAKIRDFCRLIAARKKTRLPRESMKHVRVGRVAIQIRRFLFTRQRNALRQSVEQREQCAARVIQTCWREYMKAREQRSSHFAAKVLQRKGNAMSTAIK